jgi:hypothetical protein
MPTKRGNGLTFGPSIPPWVSAPAPKQQAPTDRQADDRSSDQNLALVAFQVPAPIGEVGDLAAQLLERDRELGAVDLDRIANLGRRALRHQLSSPSAAIS